MRFILLQIQEKIMNTKSITQEKTLDFAIRIVNLFKYLIEEKREFIMSKQIMRSGTSPGAMVREARNAENASDFIHKLGIAQKEIEETRYWLELLQKTNYLKDMEFQSLDSDANEISRLIKSSIITKKENLIQKE